MTGAAGCLATGNYGFLAIKCGIDISMTVSHVIVFCQPCFPLLFFLSSLVADERFLPGETFSRDAKRQKACHICANLMRVISMRVLEHLRRHRISVACITGMQSTAFAFSSWFLAAAEQTPQSGTAKQLPQQKTEPQTANQNFTIAKEFRQLTTIIRKLNMVVTSKMTNKIV